MNALATISKSIILDPSMIPTDGEEFQKHYYAAHTGVPFSEAHEFSKFLTSVIESRHFGQKYARKFCNGYPKITKPAHIWIQRMTICYAGGLSQALIELGDKGMMICDALYGENRGPDVDRGVAPVPGYIQYRYRTTTGQSAVFNVISGIPTSIKSTSAVVN